MPVDRVAILAGVLTPLELDALRAAAAMARGLMEHFPEALSTYGEALDELGPDLIAARAIAGAAEKVEACTNCGTTIEACDAKVEREARGCCGVCAVVNAHPGERPDGYARRRRVALARAEADVAAQRR